jgi:hypothetical protein
MTGIATILGNTPTLRFKDYVTNDPNGELNQHCFQNPECTYQAVIQALWLCDPPQTKTAIASYYHIPYHAFNAHYNRHFDPNFIHRLILEQGFFDDEAQKLIRYYLDTDPDQQLQQCYLKNFPYFNAQTLAQRRFTWYEVMQSFEAIATDDSLNPQPLTAKQIEALAKKIEKFWTQTACPFVAQTVLRDLAYGSER